MIHHHNEKQNLIHDSIDIHFFLIVIDFDFSSKRGDRKMKAKVWNFIIQFFFINFLKFTLNIKYFI